MSEDKKPNSVGRPTKYKEEYCEDMVEWFESHPLTKTKIKNIYSKGELVGEEEYEVPAKPPTFYRYAVNIGVCFDTLKEWVTVHPKFSAAYKKAKSIQASFIVENAMTDVGPTTFSIFMMKNNHNWTDKVEQKVEQKTTLEHLVNDSLKDE